MQVILHSGTISMNLAVCEIQMELNGYKTSICKQTPGDAVNVIGLKEQIISVI